jgi:hypothetical protein
MAPVRRTSAEFNAWCAARDRTDARRVRRARKLRAIEPIGDAYHAHIRERADELSRGGGVPDEGTLRHVLAVQKHKEMMHYERFGAHVVHTAREAIATIPAAYVIDDEAKDDIAEIDEAVARFGDESFAAEAIASKLFKEYFIWGTLAIYRWPRDVRHAAFEILDSDSQQRYARFAHGWLLKEGAGVGAVTAGAGMSSTWSVPTISAISVTVLASFLVR